jgi:hypothetical protein
MPVGPGTRLGPYEILSAIGAGGMGEVYAIGIPYHSTNRLNVSKALISLTQYDVVSQQWSRLLKIALFTVLATKERLRSDV